MKNLFKSLAFLALATVSFTACSDDKDKCTDVVCTEGAICVDGTCACETGMFMDDNNTCQLDKTKFLGSYNVTRTCPGNDPTLITEDCAIVNYGGANDLRILRLLGENSELFATISGNNVTIEKTLHNGLFYVGTGTLENNVITINMTITLEYELDGIIEVRETNECTFVLDNRR